MSKIKLAVLSDIHSNNIALAACLQYLTGRNFDGFILLGDTISDCPDPQAVLSQIEELSRQYPVYQINGNREEYFLKHEKEEDGWDYSSYKGSLLYTYEHLKKCDLEAFSKRENHMVLSLPGAEALTLVHGSPASSRELLYAGAENTDQYLRECKTTYLLCGHTHSQYAYQHAGHILLNPGSVGVAAGDIKMAHFAVIEWNGETWNHKLMGIPFDYEVLKKRFLESSLMEKAKVWPRAVLSSMETGINLGPKCAKFAYDLAKEKEDFLPHKTVPECYWEMAAIHYRIFGWNSRGEIENETK